MPRKHDIPKKVQDIVFDNSKEKDNYTEIVRDKCNQYDNYSATGRMLCEIANFRIQKNILPNNEPDYLKDARMFSNLDTYVDPDIDSILLYETWGHFLKKQFPESNPTVEYDNNRFCISIFSKGDQELLLGSDALVSVANYENYLTEIVEDISILKVFGGFMIWPLKNASGMSFNQISGTRIIDDRKDKLIKNIVLPYYENCAENIGEKNQIWLDLLAKGCSENASVNFFHFSHLPENFCELDNLPTDDYYKELAKIIKCRNEIMWTFIRE